MLKKNSQQTWTETSEGPLNTRKCALVSLPIEALIPLDWAPPYDLIQL